MLTRRTFLGSTALAGLGLASAACSSPMRIGHGRAARPLDSKLRLGVVGVGNRGWSNLEGVGGEVVAALCDVDARYLAKAAERHPDAKQFRDFRRMLAECELDGVVISTPDHTHFPAACMAMQRGLDVYCEKPLTHTVAQARRLNELATERGLITQMGTQIHSWPNYRRVVEIVRSGMLGKVKEVHVFVNGVDWSARELPAAAPVPEYLDWDLWLGPAAEREFAADFHPMGWRRCWAFGGGTTADMACHYMDLAFWALSLAPGEPDRYWRIRELVADGTEAPHESCAPKGNHCLYRFESGPTWGNRPDELVLTWWAGNDRPTVVLASRGLDAWKNGVLFIGDKGWVIGDYTRHELGPKGAFDGVAMPEKTIADSIGHYREWIEGCKQRTLPPCHFGYSGPLTEAVLLANVAYRAARGGRLYWYPDDLRLGRGDSDSLTAAWDREASALLDVAPRSGFEC